MAYSAIWAQSLDGIIGDGHSMPWHLPEDLAHFKELTSGSPVIMGRRTWLSLPPRFRPLPGRENIVLSTRAPGPWSEGATVCSREQLPGEGWILGGGQVYHDFLSLCERLEITLVRVRLADSHPTAPLVAAPPLPEDAHLAQDSGWLHSPKGRLLPGFSVDPDAQPGLDYRFLRYHRSLP